MNKSIMKIKKYDYLYFHINNHNKLLFILTLCYKSATGT